MHYYSQWLRITDDKTILSWIRGYKINFDAGIVQPLPPTPPVYTQPEILQFREIIANLIHIGAISECEPIAGQFLSNIFLIPKSNGKMRFILNLKKLNQFISTQHFKLEDLRTALKLVTKDCMMGTVDLKDAYFLLPIHKESRKYLRFSFHGKMYEFQVLPFGLNTAPFVFTKLMKPVTKLLRTAGFLSTLYLDDWYLLGRTITECRHNINITRKLLSSLGFLINENKSSLSPSTSCKFLGVIIDSENLEVRLPRDKIIRIKTEINNFMKLKRCKIRTFAKLIGLLVSACTAVEYGWLYTKELERWKYLNLRNQDDYNKYIDIPTSLFPDLHWWLNVIDNSSRRIRNDDHDLEIFSDSSTKGWGGGGVQW